MANDVTSKRHKILTINFGGIGDEILFLPTLMGLRKYQPDAHITLILEPRSSSVTELTDLVDQIITFDIKKRPLMVSDLLNLLGLLRSGNYQTVISSGSSPLVSLLLFLSQIPERIGYDSGPVSRLLLTGAVKLNYKQYAANMYYDLLSELRLPQKSVVPEVQVPAESLLSMTNFLQQSRLISAQGKKVRLVLHPGTSLLAIKKGIIKTWDACSWVSLIESLLNHADFEIILAGGPDDQATIRQILDLAGAKNLSERLLSAYGVTKTLGDLAALIQLSDLLICVDSAPMHIGVGLGKPLVALFGPTDPNKLLPNDTRFKPLFSRKESLPLDIDQTMSGTQTIEYGKSIYREPSYKTNGRNSLTMVGAPGVQLQPDTVYRCVLDHLEQKTIPERSPSGYP